MEDLSHLWNNGNGLPAHTAGGGISDEKLRSGLTVAAIARAQKYYILGGKRPVLIGRLVNTPPCENPA